MAKQTQIGENTTAIRILVKVFENVKYFASYQKEHRMKTTPILQEYPYDTSENAV